MDYTTQSQPSKGPRVRFAFPVFSPYSICPSTELGVWVYHVYRLKEFKNKLVTTSGLT
jgi:hypothetical protein